jgi:general secretion pathway protein J
MTLEAAPNRGLTLIEVLVAVFALALMTVMSNQVLDLLLRSQVGADRYSTNLSSLQIGLAQWQRDLDRLDRTPYVNALQWDGQVLRLLRRSASGDALLVVAWTVQDGVWKRWQSPPLRDREGLLQAWQQSPTVVTARPKAPLAPSTDPAMSAYVLRLEAWELVFQGQGQITSGVSERGDTRLQELPQVLRLRLTGLAEAGLNGPLQIDVAL